MEHLVFGKHLDSSSTTESIGTQTERKKRFSHCESLASVQKCRHVDQQRLTRMNFSGEAEEWGWFSIFHCAVA